MTCQKPVLRSLPAFEVIQTHIGKGNDAIDNLQFQTRTNDSAYEADQ
jgi:hypothetical protein